MSILAPADLTDAQIAALLAFWRCYWEDVGVLDDDTSIKGVRYFLISAADAARLDDAAGAVEDAGL